MESPDASAHGKPREGHSIGAYKFRLVAKEHEGDAAFLARQLIPPRYAYLQSRPGITQVDLDEMREQSEAVAKQLRVWQYRAERDATFRMRRLDLFDHIDEIVASVVRLQQRRTREPEGEAHEACCSCSEDGHAGHNEARSSQHLAAEEDAAEAHWRDAAEAHPIEDAAEAHESTVDCPGFRRRAKEASVAEGEPHVPEDTSRGVTLEREPAGGDAAVITASCSGATFVGKSAGSEDEDDNLERLLVATPAVTGVGKSAGSEDDDDNLERLLVATPAVTIVEYSAGLEGDYLERFFVATPAVTWSKTAKQAFRRAAAAQWKAEQSWIGARRRPWTGVREALDTG